MNSSASIMTKTGLPLVVDVTTELLILVSFPGDASLAKGEYYANSSNQFWRLIAALESIPTLGYQKVVLPSSSGANTHAGVDEKTAIWRDQILRAAGPY